MSNRRRPNLGRAAEREAANMRVNGSPPPLVRPHFPGVDASAWTDLPPAQYPPDTVTFIRQALELGEARKTIKGYRCDRCDKVAATLDRHPGFSPDRVDHRHIEADTRCAGTFVSFGYPDEDLPDGAAPSHEWHRPAEPELLSLPDAFINHVMGGGLILRPNRDLEAGR